MTVTSLLTKVTALGNGSATTFSFSPVVITQSGDLSVTKLDASGNETALIQDTDYTVTVATYPGTGSITYPISGTSLQTGESVTMARILPLTQTTDLENQGGYFADVQEDAFDKATMIDQQLQEQINRSILYPVSDPVLGHGLPSAQTRAGLVLGFDSSGVPIAVSALPEATVSSALTSFLQASATLAAAGLLGAATQVADVTALRALTTSTFSGSALVLLNFATAGDAGGGVFVLGAGTDDGGTRFVDASSRTWVRQCAPGVLFLSWFGSGSTALAAALAALPSRGGAIVLPAGKITMSAAVSYSYPTTDLYSVSLLGSGADVTELYWANTDGLSFAACKATQSLHIRDMTLSTGAVNAHTALNLTNSVLEGNYAQSEVERVTIRGADGGQQTQCWGAGVNNVGWSNFAFPNCHIFGDSTGTKGLGIAVAGNAATSPFFALVFNMMGGGLYNLGIGFKYGSYIQGVTLSQVNIVNGVTGVYQPSGAIGGAQLTLLGCNINTFGNQISLAGELACLTVIGNSIFIVANTTGILWASGGGGGNQNTIIGNTFGGLSPTGSTGIVVKASVGNTTVSGNTFYNLANGIDLEGANNWSVGINSYSSVANMVINPTGGGNNRIAVPAALTPVAAQNTGSSVTSLSATTGSFAAPCTGVMHVFGEAHSAGNSMSTCSLSTSLSGFVSLQSSGDGSGGSAFGYLPMQMGQTSTFTVTATQTAANLMVNVRCVFVPSPS